MIATLGTTPLAWCETVYAAGHEQNIKLMKRNAKLSVDRRFVGSAWLFVERCRNNGRSYGLGWVGYPGRGPPFLVLGAQKQTSPQMNGSKHSTEARTSEATRLMPAMVATG